MIDCSLEIRAFCLNDLGLNLVVFLFRLKIKYQPKAPLNLFSLYSKFVRRQEISSLNIFQKISKVFHDEFSGHSRLPSAKPCRKGCLE